MSPYRHIINSIQKLFRPSTIDRIPIDTALRLAEPPLPMAIVVPRAEHQVSRADLSKNSVRVLYTLHKAGYQAFMVGGGVRDVLVGQKPKDFDLVTDAKPDEIKKLFRNCRLIGRRFRLAHVHFGDEIIEVATFRALHDPDENTQDHGDARVVRDGLVVRDNVYGTFEEDAARRDFTINALYYNIADFSLVDFHHGLADLRAGIVRLIGDPILRYREDPVRMLRAVRFVAKLNFRIEEKSEAPIRAMGELLVQISPSRLFDEVQKMFLSGHAEASLRELRRYDLLRHLFPQTAVCLENNQVAQHFLEAVCRNTDQRVMQDKRASPTFLLAAFLWYPFLELAAQYRNDQIPEQESLDMAGHQIFREQRMQVSVPRRLALPIRDIWILQHRYEQNSGKRALRILHHPSFRAGYDFLLLRAEAEPSLKPLAKWWTTFYHADEAGRLQLLEEARQATVSPTDSPSKRRRRRKKAKAKIEQPQT